MREAVTTPASFLNKTNFIWKKITKKHTRTRADSTLDINRLYKSRLHETGEVISAKELEDYTSDDSMKFTYNITNVNETWTTSELSSTSNAGKSIKLFSTEKGLGTSAANLSRRSKGGAVKGWCRAPGTPLIGQKRERPDRAAQAGAPMTMRRAPNFIVHAQNGQVAAWRV